MNLARKKVDVLEQFSNCFLLYAKTLVLCDDISSRWSFCSDSSFSGNDLLAPEMLNTNASNYSLLMPLIPKKYTPLVLWGSSYLGMDAITLWEKWCAFCAINVLLCGSGFMPHSPYQKLFWQTTMIDAFVIKLRWRVLAYEGQNVFRKFWIYLFLFVITRNEENCRHLDFEHTFQTVVE